MTTPTQTPKAPPKVFKANARVQSVGPTEMTISVTYEGHGYAGNTYSVRISDEEAMTLMHDIEKALYRKARNHRH